jgi:hypothetical protein
VTKLGAIDAVAATTPKKNESEIPRGVASGS